jgi:hypothetical protein
VNFVFFREPKAFLRSNGFYQHAKKHNPEAGLCF